MNSATKRMSRVANGSIIVDGRQLDLASVHTGIDARDRAMKEAADRRVYGETVRVRKVSAYHYKLFALGAGEP